MYARAVKFAERVEDMMCHGLPSVSRVQRGNGSSVVGAGGGEAKVAV